MSTAKLVDEDASQLETKEFRQMFERQEGMLRDKDVVVADIKDGYDRADRRGIDKPAFKVAIGWRKKGGLKAFQLHVAKVTRYLSAMGEEAQLDIFAQAMTAPIFMPKTEAEKAEDALADADLANEDGVAGDNSLTDALGEGGETMRPIGEVIAPIVETVTQMHQQDQAEAAEPTPDQQAEAKLQGEAAGRRGASPTENPYPAGSSLHLWFCKGFHPGAAEWERKNPTVTKIPGSKISAKFKDTVTTTHGKDKTPRMPAAEAARILAGSSSDN